MRKFIRNCGTAAIVLGLLIPGVRAQQQVAANSNNNNGTPKPAPPVSAIESSSYGPYEPPSDPSEMTPDDHPLVGVQQIGVGSLPTTRNYVLFSFDATFTGDSNALNANRGSGWSSLMYLLGSVALQRQTATSQLMLTYSGGGLASGQNSDVANSMIHKFDAAQTFRWQRWSLLLSDSLSYSPESPFGFGGLTTLGSPSQTGTLGGGSLNLQPGVGPVQNIYTLRGARLENTFAPEVDYQLSPRSTITLSGSYGLLHFRENGFLDTRQGTFMGGYSYLLSPRDSVGFQYQFTDFRYPGLGQVVDMHSFHLAYGRRVTGRMGFTVAAGPQVVLLQVPGSPNASHLQWSASAGLNYELGHTSLNAGYLHSLSGGSGVFAGSNTDQVTLSAARPLSRNLFGAITGGYARNASLQSVFAGTTNQTIGAWFAGAGISRNLGRTMQARLSYDFRQQNSTQGACVGTVCSPVLVRHTISLTFGWRPRPIAIE